MSHHQRPREIECVCWMNQAEPHRANGNKIQTMAMQSMNDTALKKIEGYQTKRITTKN